MESEEKKGRCVGCGYLSWRRHGDDSSPYYEVTEDRRVSGEKPASGEMKDVSHAPYCYRRVDIHKHFEVVKGRTGDKRQSLLEVIREQRNCPHYFPHTDG
jgi:hypothetical protein